MVDISKDSLISGNKALALITIDGLSYGIEPIEEYYEIRGTLSNNSPQTWIPEFDCEAGHTVASWQNASGGTITISATLDVGTISRIINQGREQDFDFIFKKGQTYTFTASGASRYLIYLKIIKIRESRRLDL